MRRPTRVADLINPASMLLPAANVFMQRGRQRARLYRDACRLGTTLQVREDMWPADRAAFDDYWKRSLDKLRVDPPVREHLKGWPNSRSCRGRCAPASAAGSGEPRRPPDTYIDQLIQRQEPSCPPFPP
jgi:ER-bound oxygenase mpaB/B'/Rubber oxygenase, catalytic domain